MGGTYINKYSYAPKYPKALLLIYWAISQGIYSYISRLYPWGVTYIFNYIIGIYPPHTYRYSIQLIRGFVKNYIWTKCRTYKYSLTKPYIVCIIESGAHYTDTHLHTHTTCTKWSLNNLHQ